MRDNATMLSEAVGSTVSAVRVTLMPRGAHPETGAQGGPSTKVFRKSARRRSRPSSSVLVCMSRAMRRALAVCLAAMLCISLGMPSLAFSETGCSLVAHEAAFAAEGAGDTGTTNPVDPPVDPSPTDPPVNPDPIPPVSTLYSVPDVTGRTVPAAVSALQAQGFTANVSGDSTATSLVMNQSPVGGTQLEAGSVVTIVGVEFSQEKTVKELGLIGYTTDAHDSWISEMARTPLGGSAYQLNDGIKEKGGKVRLMVQASWSDGNMYSQSDAGWLDLGGAIAWTTSDPTVATVNSTGVVTAVSDGEVVITATAPNGVASTMSFVVIGQNGAFVTSARITDETGEPYGTSYLDIFDRETGSRTFYVRATYSDGTVKCNAPLASDYTAEAAAALASSCVWSIDSTDVGSVNAASGSFVPLHDGRTQVVATLVGGDPGVNGGLVVASVSINVNEGTFDGGNAPSSQLVINIEYESMPGVVGKTETLSIGALQSIQNASCTYTLTKSGGSYVTDTAQGIYLSTLLDHLSIVTGEVLYFKFAANDGANPGAITNSFLFGYTRYYYPNADGASTAGAVPVAPMLAYADSWREGGTCEPSSELNSGTCLRLLFGSTGLADNSTSKSIKFINTITVVLDGAPPTGWGDGTNPGGTDPGKGGGVESDGSGDKGAIGTGGNANATGNANISKSASSEGDDVQEMATQQTAGPVLESSGNTDAAAESGGSRWQVYEMIAKRQSDVDPIVLVNPFEPYAIPLVVATVAAGAVASGMRFRRKLPDDFDLFGMSPPAAA
ncbi:MAG: PASTA domain-containing protein [Gordonibacter sp.]|nr:PASTA domain-containing protein [Gordonibacter sp.]